MQKNKVIILATDGLTTAILYEGLSLKFDITCVFIEEEESKKDILKRRFKKLGLWKTLGQILFLVLILPFISKRKKRIATILEKSNLKGNKIPTNRIQKIKSVHDLSLIEKIKAEKPTLVFINGTRILKKELIEAIACRIVNIHVGITPKYRGVHGGYWAIRNKEPHLFGVTVHFVDKGIDTGKIIAQEIIKTQNEDNFKTYPLLQYCKGVELILKNSSQLSNTETKEVKKLTEESKLYYHPTIWEYVFGKK